MVTNSNLFAFVASLSIVFIHISRGLIPEDRGQATLKIRWHYQNREALLENGEQCEFYRSLGCTIHFELCLRHGGDYLKGCTLFQLRTKRYKRVLTLTDEAIVRIRQPLPATYTFEVKVDAINVLKETEQVASFAAYTFKVPSNGNSVPIPMRRIASGYRNPGVRLTVSGILTCDEFYFGDRCQHHCRPNASSYTCTPEGQRICKYGYRGALCDIVDWCTLLPCVGKAKCKLLPDGSGRECICQEPGDLDCVYDTDPCDLSPCQNGGLCHTISIPMHLYRCECSEPWSGIHCTERSACQITMNISDIGALSQSPCLNGGRCIDQLNGSSYLCQCHKGWIGTRCELSIASIGKNIALAAGIPLLFLVILLTGGFWYVRRRKAIKSNQDGQRPDSSAEASQPHPDRVQKYYRAPIKTRTANSENKTEQLENSVSASDTHTGGADSGGDSLSLHTVKNYTASETSDSGNDFVPPMLPKRPIRRTRTQEEKSLRPGYEQRPTVRFAPVDIGYRRPEAPDNTISAIYV
ncbi:Protein lag-2 [Clonorchis sinensis]|uniref:Delta-like protein n=1 Tax=Clonorchis sinensis TaxID=79923 RepID=A0A8T1MID8_CLOSI|nr:Protein lag-2 [Clonorchis sinensis]